MSASEPLASSRQMSLSWSSRVPGMVSIGLTNWGIGVPAMIRCGLPIQRWKWLRHPAVGERQIGPQGFGFATRRDPTGQHVA